MANVTVATSTFYIVWHKPFLKRGRANVSYIIYVYMSAEDRQVLGHPEGTEP